MLVYVERHGTRSYLTRDGAKFVITVIFQDCIFEVMSCLTVLFCFQAQG